MARGVRLPRTAGRPPRFLRTGHRRATSLSEAHLQAARRDAGHTLGREAEGVLHSLLFHRASRGLRVQRATFRVLAEGDADVDAALASAVGCSPPPRSLTPPRRPLSDQRARAARLRRCPDCPIGVANGAGLGLELVAPALRAVAMRRPDALYERCSKARVSGRSGRRGARNERGGRCYSGCLTLGGGRRHGHIARYRSAGRFDDGGARRGGSSLGEREGRDSCQGRAKNRPLAPVEKCPTLLSFVAGLAG